MKILGIETSCDETALAIVEVKGDLKNPQISILKEALNSQTKIHEQYGGVFPMMAKREHQTNLPILLSEIGLSKDERPDIDFIAVTSGPGLEPCLWTGITFAQELSKAWGMPLLPADHMEGHIASVLANAHVEFPLLALLISGGHTELVRARDWGEYEIVGQTLDDAVGEAYDKVARILELPYPGGPQISKLAGEARAENASDPEITFPRMMLNDRADFSLSGLKTSVLYKVKALETAAGTPEAPGKLTDIQKKIVAKEFEEAIVDQLIRKTRKAIEIEQPKTFIAAGGVTANTYIKDKLTELCAEYGIPAIFPPHNLSTDNAVMIALAGFVKQHREHPSLSPEMKAAGNQRLDPTK